VENTSEYFAHQVMADARRLVGEFNEQLVLDSKACLDQVRQNWLIRYGAAHPLTRPIFALQFGFYDSLVGVGQVVDNDHHCFVNEHKVQILALATVAKGVIADLAESRG
jgi:hypothetical protein